MLASFSLENFKSYANATLPLAELVDAFAGRQHAEQFLLPLAVLVERGTTSPTSRTVHSAGAQPTGS